MQYRQPTPLYTFFIKSLICNLVFTIIATFCEVFLACMISLPKQVSKNEFSSFLKSFDYIKVAVLWHKRKYHIEEDRLKIKAPELLDIY